MFYNTSAFDQPIGGWAAGRVRDFRWMLRAATSSNQNLVQWTVDPGADIDGMFYCASGFQKAHAPWATAAAYEF